MSWITWISNIIKRFIIKRASRHKAVDIVEVRIKQVGLLSVFSETDLRIRNSFFLPYTLLSVQTDLLNKDGLKVGKMIFDKPTKVKGNSELVFTTTSEISIITSLFQALSNLLSQPIWMRSVGVATVKVLWFTIELPVDDVFEIHPSKLKILKEESEEERALRLQKEAERKQQRIAKEAEKKIQRDVKQEERKEKRDERRAAYKEKILKRRHKENYVPKELRQDQLRQDQLQQTQPDKEPLVADDPESLKIELDAVVLNAAVSEPIIEDNTNDEIKA